MANGEQALDFSLKKSSPEAELRGGRARMPSGGSDRTSSSPQSSQSPSSTTLCPDKLSSPASLGHLASFLQQSSAITGQLGSLQGMLRTGGPISSPLFPAGPLVGDPFSPNAMSRAMHSSWLQPGSPPAPNLLQTIPDPAFFPTASLALSTLHRRRRTSTANQNASLQAPSNQSEPTSPKKPKLVDDQKKVR